MSLKPIDFYDMDKWGVDEERGLEDREQKAIKIIHSNLGQHKTAKILDIGCGNGFFLSQLQKTIGSKNIDYFGADYSKYMVKHAKRLRPGMTFKVCNLEESIPFADQSMDIIYCGEVIEHIYNPDIALEECHRVLKDGGLLLLTTPNLNAWYNRVLFVLGVQPIFYETSTKSARNGAGMMRRFKQQDVPVGHIRVFNRTALGDLLRAEGFEVLYFRGSIFHGLPGLVRTVDKLFNIRPSMASNLIAVARKNR